MGEQVGFSNLQISKISEFFDKGSNDSNCRLCEQGPNVSQLNGKGNEMEFFSANIEDNNISDRFIAHYILN